MPQSAQDMLLLLLQVTHQQTVSVKLCGGKAAGVLCSDGLELEDGLSQLSELL